MHEALVAEIVKEIKARHALGDAGPPSPHSKERLEFAILALSERPPSSNAILDAERIKETLAEWDQPKQNGNP